MKMLLIVAFLQKLLTKLQQKFVYLTLQPLMMDIKKIGLTEKEFRLLKSLDRDSRTMLIKQSNSSVFAKMDLYGFDDFLPIFSGTKAGTLLAKRIIDEIGSDDPNLWIPIFLEKIKESKNF